jgi:predicted RNase H-like nuclease (RuvC/YqgF family)
LENYNLPEVAYDILFEKEIPILRAEKYNILRSNYVGITNQADLLKAKEDFQSYRKNRIKLEKSEKIYQTIENYKFEREKELKDDVKNYDNYEVDEYELEFD